MKAVKIYQAGGAEQLIYQDVPTPDIKAEYVLLPNEQIYPVHTDLDWKTLASIPETYYTAFGSLQQLRIAAARSCVGAWCRQRCGHSLCVAS